MKLSVTERVHLLGLLPTESDFVTLGITNKFKDKIRITEADSKKHKIIPMPDKSVSWNQSANKDFKEYQIGDIVKAEIKKSLKKLNDEKKLTTGLISLYDKFIEHGKKHN